MPRYFFHVRDESSRTSDEEGQEFPDLEAAHAEALAAIDKLAADFPPDFEGTDIVFEIANDSGKVVLIVPFRNVGVHQADWALEILQ